MIAPVGVRRGGSRRSAAARRARRGRGRRRGVRIAATVLLAGAVGACGGSSGADGGSSDGDGSAVTAGEPGAASGEAGTTSPAPAASSPPAGSAGGGPAADGETAADRVAALGDAVAAWSGAATIEEAHAAAERAANLVVGPDGPGYGDRDGDGSIEGASDVGLLPGLAGAPGLAGPPAANDCVTADVLGPAADDPAAAWSEMASAIEAWRPDRNTMPSLASHPMRVVGWATFTLASDDLDEAREDAGHAGLHVRVTDSALTCD